MDFGEESEPEDLIEEIREQGCGSCYPFPSKIFTLLYLLVNSPHPMVWCYIYYLYYVPHFDSTPLHPARRSPAAPSKVQIFGVCCEPIGCQVFFLIDESEQAPKGANTVVSLLHAFFNLHGMQEKTVFS